MQDKSTPKISRAETPMKPTSTVYRKPDFNGNFWPTNRPKFAPDEGASIRYSPEGIPVSKALVSYDVSKYNKKYSDFLLVPIEFANMHCRKKPGLTKLREIWEAEEWPLKWMPSSASVEDIRKSYYGQKCVRISPTYTTPRVRIVANSQCQTKTAKKDKKRQTYG